MVSDLTKRLRHAHVHSAQRIMGSNIFEEAADEIDRLTRELAEARRERDLLAYHVAPHTDEEFRGSHLAEQIIDAGLQRSLKEKPCPTAI